MRKSVVTMVLVILPLVCSAANDRPAEQLRSVSSIYISGNNQAAEGARRVVTAGKTCFTLATKADAADAVLEVAAESQSMGGPIGGLGGRSSVVSGTLTLRSGD